MVSLKILVFLALIVAVTCEPTLGKLRLKGRLKRCKIGKDLVVRKGWHAGIIYMLKGLGSRCKMHKRLYNDLIKIRVPTDIDTTLSFILKLGLGSASGVNVWIPGLGDLLSRLIGLALRLVVCVLGLLGNRGYCGGNYVQNYLDISVSGITNIDTLYEKFRCHNARDELDGYIDKASKGKGISYFTGSRKIMIEIARRLVTVVEKKKKCTKADLTEIVSCVLTSGLCMSNLYAQNLGNQISDDTVKTVDTYIVKSGCPSLSDRKSKIVNTITEVNDEEDVTWDELFGTDSGDVNTSDGDDGGKKSDDDNDGGKKNDDDDNDGGKKKDDDDNDGGKKKDDDNDGGKKNNDDDDGGKKKDNDGGKKKDDDSTAVDVTPRTPLTKVIYVFVGPIVNKRGHVRVPPKILRALLEMDTITNISDVGRLLTYLSIIIGNILDALCRGLGELITKIIITIIRISLCIKGKGNDGYCGRDFGDIYGVRIDATTIEGLKKQLKVGGALDQYRKIIDAKTSGKGKKAVQMKSLKIVLDICGQIASELDNYSESSLGNIYLYLSSLVGCMANSSDKKRKLGDELVSNLSSSCDKYIKQKGYKTITDNKVEVDKSVQEGKVDGSFNYVLTTTVDITITTNVDQVQATQEIDTE